MKPEPEPNALAAWNAELETELEALRARHLFRDPRTEAGVDFTSNDYLSLNANGTLRALLGEILADWTGPIGSTGSRLLRGQSDAFDRAEAAFAKFTGQSSALLFHSGHAANLGVLPALLGPHDHVFCDRLAHATLLDGIRLAGVRRYYFAHNDLNDLQEKLRKYPPSGRGRAWIVSETVFSMDGDRPDLVALTELAERAGALLLLDEAHAIGVYGPAGAGLVRAADLTARVAVTVYPMGKAPGLMGAFVCGPAPLRQFLINRARSFIFSTAQPPLFAVLLERVLKILATAEMETIRTRLFALATRLREELKSRGIMTSGDSQIVPVIAGTEERALEWARSCRKHGLDARAIRPPSVPPDSSRLRITMQAARTDEELGRLVRAIV